MTYALKKSFSGTWGKTGCLRLFKVAQSAPKEIFTRRLSSSKVSLSEPYSLSADIYSFAILLWELLSLEKAFGELSSEEHKENVIKGDQRLPFDKEWPLPITYLLSACWDPDPFKRPSARDVVKSLRQVSQVIRTALLFCVEWVFKGWVLCCVYFPLLTIQIALSFQELSMCYDSLRSNSSGPQERRPSY